MLKVLTLIRITEVTISIFSGDSVNILDFVIS